MQSPPLNDNEGPEPIVTLPPSTLSQCLCPDHKCDYLNNGKPCVDPVYSPPWWLLNTTRSCELVVDPEFGVTLTGTVYAQARECDSNKVARVIDIDDNWLIDVHITLSGTLPRLLCGLWCVSACLESMCGDTHYRFPHDSADSPYCCCLVETNQFATDYEIRICIPAGVVKESECGAPYELTVIVTLLTRDQNPNKPGDKCDPGTYMPLGVATACELPLMTFYDGG